jgi:hypothetical protein
MVNPHLLVGLKNLKRNKMEETVEKAAHKMLMDFGIMSVGESIHVLNVKKLMVLFAKEQQERMYSEEDMLDFAWYLIKNVGQYSDDRIAHFEGKYLEQFKKK